MDACESGEVQNEVYLLDMFFNLRKWNEVLRRNRECGIEQSNIHSGFSNESHSGSSL
jgi:hypothetical protein